MKYFLLISILFTSQIFTDYSEHPEAQDLINDLVQQHGFERSYVIKVLQAAEKKIRS